MKPSLYLLLLSLALWTIPVGCQEDDRNDPAFCQEINCTDILLSISITITDQHGEPMALDHFYTLNLNNRHPYYFQNSTHEPLMVNSGSYPLVSDAYIDEIAFEGTHLLFIGYKDGEVAVRELYEVGRDCCHVHLITGDTTVTL